ncbi:MAG: hypothetical protein NTV21_05450 [Planctomycetota bacterium]|nr:hypothetical protein [Planctomycetota bacterium]
MLHFCPIIVSVASALSAGSNTSLLAPAPELASYERLGLATAALPAEKTSLLSYTYLEVGYLSTDVDRFDESTDAVYGRLSIDLVDLVYVFADYAAESIDDVSQGGSSGDVDSDQYGLGVGVHMNVAPDLDVLGEAAWLYSDLSSRQISNLDDTNNGWTAFGGVRWLVLPWPTGGLELNGGVRWTDLPTLLSDDKVISWEAGARAHFIEFLSVGLRLQLQEDDRTYAINARLSF